MAPKKKRGACAYCAAVDVVVEIEHVFPRNWYPDGYPPSQMMTVPACRKCNGDFGQLEERLFLPLVSVLAESDTRARGIVKRALAGATATAGKSVREVSFRDARRRKLLRNMEVITAGSDSAPVWYPGIPSVLESGPVTTPQGLVVNGIPSLRINPEDLRHLGLKLLRGTYCFVKGNPIPSTVPCSAGTFAQNPREVLESAAKNLHLNDGGAYPLRWRFARATEDDTTTLWFFLLWDTYVFRAGSGAAADAD